MTDIEKEICDDTLRYGTIISDKEFDCGNEHFRQYIVEEDGETYSMTKMNGEWIYFFHHIN